MPKLFAAMSFCRPWRERRQLPRNPPSLSEPINFLVPWGAPLGLQVPVSGISDIFLSNVMASAPNAVFNVEGPDNKLFAAIFRLENNLLATLSNPIRRNEVAIAFTTGLGAVAPLLLDGNAAPTTPLSVTVTQPTVTVGSAGAEVLYSGLAPGFVGLYQINFLVPWGAPLGLQVPVTISAGGVSEKS